MSQKGDDYIDLTQDSPRSRCCACRVVWVLCRWAANNGAISFPKKTISMKFRWNVGEIRSECRYLFTSKLPPNTTFFACIFLVSFLFSRSTNQLPLFFSIRKMISSHLARLATRGVCQASCLSSFYSSQTSLSLGQQQLRHQKVTYPLQGAPRAFFSSQKEPAPKNQLTKEEWVTQEHIIWTKEEMEGVQQTHEVPVETWDKLAFTGTKVVRGFFDVASGYSFGPITEKKLLRRIVFLETVAGIPGMVAGSLRHLKSLRRIESDMGWIQTLLDEAENERMHLLVFREIAQPSLLTKAAVFFSQIIAWNAFFSFYMIAPKACHRFVGYIEEEAVHTYTGAIDLLRAGKLPTWAKKPCPPAGIEYWGLRPEATMEDLLLAVRADEAHHRDVNHMFANIDHNSPNPIAKRRLPRTP